MRLHQGYPKAAASLRADARLWCVLMSAEGTMGGQGTNFAIPTTRPLSLKEDSTGG